ALPVVDVRMREDGPLAVGGVQIDRRLVERPDPLGTGRIEVRVGDTDRLYTPQCADSVDGLVVEVAHAVPEHVSRWRLHEQCSLTDRKGGLGADAGEAGLLFAQNIAVPRLLHGGHRRPLLASPAHVLALIEADGATRR